MRDYRPGDGTTDFSKYKPDPSSYRVLKRAKLFVSMHDHNETRHFTTNQYLERRLFYADRHYGSYAVGRRSHIGRLDRLRHRSRLRPPAESSYPHPRMPRWADPGQHQHAGNWSTPMYRA